MLNRWKNIHYCEDCSKGSKAGETSLPWCRFIPGPGACSIKKTAKKLSPQPYYFKRPVDCDDEESLEERRGRTVLRTAMLSTRANRINGPPDGTQPEFDLLLFCSVAKSLSDRAAYCIGCWLPWLKWKTRPRRQTIHHNSSSRKARVTWICGCFSRNMGSKRCAV